MRKETTRSKNSIESSRTKEGTSHAQISLSAACDPNICTMTGTRGAGGVVGDTTEPCAKEARDLRGCGRGMLQCTQL